MKKGLSFRAQTKKSKHDMLDFLEGLRKIDIKPYLHKFGQAGVQALRAYTPIDTGRLSQSWYYTIDQKEGKSSITWSNSDVQNGCVVAIIVQYGHAATDGTFVQGTDYINPALAQIFWGFAEQIWKEVTQR